MHPDWGSRGSGMDQGDIALVKFGGGLPAGYKRVSAMNDSSSIRKGARVVLAGYGISNARERSGAGRLRKAEVRVAESRTGKQEMILDQSHGQGACHGDSGGPAFLRRKGKLILAGLTNRSYPAQAPDDCAHQVVYTKVPAYRRWILSNERKLAQASQARISGSLWGEVSARKQARHSNSKKRVRGKEGRRHGAR